MLYDHWPGEATEALQQHLISLIGICRIRNIKVVLSTIANTSQIAWLIKEKDPRLNKVFNHLPPSVVLAAIRSYNEVIRQVASQYGVPLLNSAERGSIAQTEELFLSDEGALQVAQGFLKITRKMGLRKKLSPTNRRESIL
jgi:serine kinase of HPr protein (carbohydrate metabolism regulator)